MDNTTWAPRLYVLTHILTSPTTTLTLHSQFFISRQIPCYLNWDYPSILCHKPSILTRWSVSLFFRRLFRLGPLRTSWRCKCPFQQPPPLMLVEGLEEAQWGEQERREYVRKRFARKRLFKNINPVIPVLLPNLFLLSLLLWNPFPPGYMQINHHFLSDTID